MNNEQDFASCEILYALQIIWQGLPWNRKKKYSSQAKLVAADPTPQFIFMSHFEGGLMLKA